MPPRIGSTPCRQISNNGPADLAAAAGDVRAAQADTTGPAPATPQQAARTAAQRYAGQVGDLVDVLDKQGVLPDDGADTIKTATKAALDPNALLTNEHLQDIGKLGLDPQTTGLIGTVLQRINSLTSPDLTTATPGPAEGFMRGPAGSVIGGALGSAAGLHGAVLGALAGQVLRPAVSAATGRVGAMVDRVLGTSSPSLLAQGQRAAAMLDAAGVTVPDTAAGLQAAMSASNNAITAQARLMGLDPAKALSAGLDAALGDKIALDRQDAGAMMRQDFVSRGGPQAQETAQARTQMLQDMQAAPGLMAQDLANRGGVQAQETSQANAQANVQRSQDVADAQAMDAARTRGLNLNDVAGNAVARIAYQKLMAEKGLTGMPTVDAARNAPTPAPGDAAGPLSPQGIATARAIAANPTGPTATQAALASLSDPVPGIEGLSKPALVQGQLLPDWQYGIGQSVMQALNLRGMPKNLSPVQVAEAAVRSLQAKQAFSPEFANALMAHSGRVVRGVYNAIRNEAMLAHGVDMRTLAAQQAG